MVRGRPKKELDTRQIFELSKMMCTMKEMAAVLDCHPDTLRDNYSNEIQKGREYGKYNLRRNQLKLAEKNAVMAIWLGKQYLDQRDHDIDESKAKKFITEIISFAGASRKDPPSS